MLLQSISLKNFRQFADESIDFSTDPEKNVTLVIGENGTGKTTFEQAFFWCLYGETEFTDKIMLNRHAAIAMTPNDTETVSVTLKLQHGGVNYTITRTQEYKKSYGNKVAGNNTVLTVAIKTADGLTRYLKPLDCEAEIQKILPKQLSHYFFFDGERVDKMSKEIAAGKKSASFAEAVIGLTGLKATLTALGHLNPNAKNSVMGRFNQSYVGNSKEQLDKLQEQIDKLQENIDTLTERTEVLDEENNTCRAKKADFEQEIKKYDDGAKLQTEKEILEKKLETDIKFRSQLIREYCKAFNDNATSFLAKKMVKRALNMIAESEMQGMDIPEMHSKTVEFLINRSECICGTHLDPGSIPYCNVKKLLEYLPPQSIGVTMGQFVKESQSMYKKEETLFNMLEEKQGEISIQEDAIAETIHEIGQIDDMLSGEDVREQVKQLKQRIALCEETIKKNDKEIAQANQRIGADKHDRDFTITKRNELATLDKNNKQIELYKAYTQKVYDEMLNEYQEKEKMVRSKLHTTMNDIFTYIYNGGLSLDLDEKYNVSVKVLNFDDEYTTETSTAQSISVVFAFISAIIKLAKDNKESDKSFAEPYPLVMDAPLSAFDKRRIKTVCESLPTTAEQVIIFIKDTDGDLAEQHLGTRVAVKHYFKMIDQYSTQLI